MMLRAIRRVASWTMLAVFCISAQARAQTPASPLSLLDVPFISQSELLCGGAAAAMVLRYWGERGIDADAFAPLVDHRAGGIPSGVLIDDLRGRGWNAIGLTGSAAALDRELNRGRPLIALIEDRPGTFHYVVLVGATPRAVVFHDPARTSFRVASRDEFDRRWAAAGRWMGLVLPAAPTEGTSAAAPAIPGAPEGSCNGLVNLGVQQARANDLDAASKTLTSALACGGPAPLRELAGVRLLQKRWPEVTDLAEAALVEDPRDDQAWRLLATGRFVQDDRVGALAAWNQVGEPRGDLLVINGLENTRQRVVERLLAVPSNAVLTPGLFTRTRRRLRDLPSASASQLEYVPVRTGLVELRATVNERSLYPDDRVSFGMIGVNALFRRELEASFGTSVLTGGGDRLTLAWRFWRNRERVAAEYVVPAPWGGIFGIDGFIERQPFKNDVLPVVHRRGAHIGTSIWPVHWMRVTGRTGIDHWKHVGDFGLAAGGVRVMTPDDRVEARVELARWLGTGGVTSFGTLEVGAIVRSTTERRGLVWIARGGAAGATVATPPDMWFAGDTGRARGIPLRAHPVVDGGRMDSEQMGRRIQFVSGEAQQWWPSRTRLQIGAAAFVDTARVDRRLLPDSKLDVDVGMGARFSARGLGGVVRIDLAHGIRDGDDALSFVYEP